MNRLEEGILFAVGGIEDPEVLCKIARKANRKLRALGFDGVFGSNSQTAVNLSDITTGDTLIIGTEHGEKTLVKVLMVNKKRVKVELLEDRGTKKLLPAGALFDYYPEMIREVVLSASVSPAASAT